MAPSLIPSHPQAIDAWSCAHDMLVEWLLGRKKKKKKKKEKKTCACRGTYPVEILNC